MQNFSTPPINKSYNQPFTDPFREQPLMANMNQGFQQQMQQHSQVAQFGAHETIQVHEVLSGMIEGINRFNLYRQFIQDSELSSILDNHLQFMNQNYNNISSYVHNREPINSRPYHGVRKQNVQYGLRNPAPMQPNANVQALDDRDVAIGMLSYHKSSALLSTISTLECADSSLRQLLQDSANSCMNQAWECFMYMNRKGMYHVPTMQQNTTQTMMNSYL